MDFLIPPSVELLLHSVQEVLADDVGCVGGLFHRMLLLDHLLKGLLVPILHSLLQDRERDRDLSDFFFDGTN